MKIVIYTYFMHKGTEKLMPWRTLVETCKAINAIDGNLGIIVSSSETDTLIKRQYQSIDITKRIANC